MGCVISSETDALRDDAGDMGKGSDKSARRFAPDASRWNPLPALGVPAAPTWPAHPRGATGYDVNEHARRRIAKKKRVAIAVEALTSSAHIKPVPKPEKTARMLLKAVKDNLLFEGLNEETRVVLVSSMERTLVPAGQNIITQGDADKNARHLYVIEQGSATIRLRPRDEAGYPIMTEPDMLVGSYQCGDSFGELALLYDCPRAATVRASFDCTLWTLDRGTYAAVKRTYQQQLALKKRQLVDSVGLLSPLSDESKSVLADALHVATYDAGEFIMKKGEVGDRFYILNAGEVAVLDEDGKELARHKEGSSFGEKALINDDVRNASIRVDSDHAECFYLNREQFNELLGEYQDIWRWLMLRRVPVLATVSDAQLSELVAVTETHTFNAGATVYQKGDLGDAMYVIEKGECVIDDGKGHSRRCTEGENFGERSLMGSETRALNVKVAPGAQAMLLSLRRSKLEAVLGDGLAEVTNKARLECLGHVHLLRSLSDAQLKALVPFLQPRQCAEGEVIFRQGDIGDRFYIVETGNVVIHRPLGENGGPRGSQQDETLKVVTQGEYFGELALLRGDPRAASATVDRGGAFILSLSREDFAKDLGPLQAILDREAATAYGVRSAHRRDKAPRQLAARSLADFKVKAVLGVGAFGKVLLATTRQGKHTYAIKTLSKAQILSAQLQKHVMQERDVMKDCDSPSLVRLVATFQDDLMLYMCMETVMGGELFNLLTRVGGSVPEATAKFYTANVVLAFQYLQAKHYVYRDLKPENLLVDTKGYLKVADFGFAKRLLPGEKTYTLCGTPEYMAPELFRQAGHNKGVDWWALGVLVYEMVVGTPPFYSPNSDSTEQMRRTVAAKYVFPSGVSAGFKDLVKRFLCVNSVQRLGCLKGGVKDVKQHAWLRTVDWVQLTRRNVPAPFVPPVKAEDDTRCFDEYDIHTAHPGDGFMKPNKRGNARDDNIFENF